MGDQYVEFYFYDTPVGLCEYAKCPEQAHYKATFFYADGTTHEQYLCWLHRDIVSLINSE